MKFATSMLFAYCICKMNEVGKLRNFSPVLNPNHVNKSFNKIIIQELFLFVKISQTLKIYCMECISVKKFMPLILLFTYLQASYGLFEHIVFI